MTDFWAKTEAVLREMEADEEYDLFAIGYVIPQVPLAEAVWEEASDPATTLIDYVSGSMDEDEISEDDRKLIQNVLQSAINNGQVNSH
ncbi:hypothetical protein [Pleionea sediminis]|uniref:hypothetical protein n=1 Tax=Pleionea sediminis TaxID=2569479 RepID=UPI0011851CA6|nr:hypothetical protein [Pleionea sediminis]